MSEEFGLVDCYVAPLLWKLRNMGVEFSGLEAKQSKAIWIVYLAVIHSYNQWVKQHLKI